MAPTSNEARSAFEGFDVRIVPLASVSDADVTRWRELADHAIEPNGDMDPRALMTVAGDADTSDLEILLIEREGSLVGVFEFSVRPMRPRLPLKVVTTAGRFMRTNSHHQYPLVAPDDPVGTFRALFRALRKGNYPRLLDIRRFPAEGSLADALTRALAAERMGSIELLRRDCAFVQAAPPGGSTIPPEEVFDFSHLSASRRKRNKERVRALERETGAKLRMVDLAGEPDALDRFIEVQASGWKGDLERGGSALGLHPDSADKYRKLIEAFKSDGALVMPTMLAGDEIVYMEVAFCSGGRVFQSLDAYLERYARFSPGSLGHLATWRYLRDVRGFSSYDPALGWNLEEGVKLYPDTRATHDLLIDNRGLLSTVAVRGLNLVPRLRAVDRATRKVGPLPRAEDGGDRPH